MTSPFRGIIFVRTERIRIQISAFLSQETLFSPNNVRLFRPDTIRSATTVRIKDPLMTKKGRSQELIAKRDAMLCRRYHYWTEIARRRFDDTLKILSEEEFFLSEEEFFLSEERILVILRRNSNLLQKLLQTSKTNKAPRRIKKETLFSGF